MSQIQLFDESIHEFPTNLETNENDFSFYPPVNVESSILLNFEINSKEQLKTLIEIEKFIF
jgi:hypothetical protein